MEPDSHASEAQEHTASIGGYLIVNDKLSGPKQLQSARVLNWGRVMIIMIIIAMVGIIGRVAQLKIRPNDRLAPAVGTATSTRQEISRRGDLVDRCGRILATTTVGYRLFIDPQVVDDVDTIAVELSRLINTNAVEIDRKVQKRAHTRYVVIEPLLEDWQVEAVRRAKLKGVDVEPRLVRFYPNQDLAAGVVGLVGFEHSGLAGVEHVFDDDLEPKFGTLTYLRDVRRRALWIDPEGHVPGEPGEEVRLSLDLVVQEFAERRLREAVRQYNAGGGRIVVADPESGEILAIADILNHRPDWTEQVEDPRRKIHPALGRNRCLTDPYEPGSTFKPFVWSTATQFERATLDEELPIPDGPWRTPYGRVIHEAHYYGPSTWRMVLIKSMNIGMAMVAERLTHHELQAIVERFGFGQETGCGLPGESPGLVTSSKKWSKYTQTSVANGHEIAVTAVQMVRAFCAFARDGSVPQLRITAKPMHDETHINQAISAPIAHMTRDIMRGVMEEGTGRLAQSEKYHIFGKSGTAQLPRRDRRGYHDDRYISSFIAGAPFEEPRIVVLCVIDDPDRRKGHFGGAIAGPVVRDVIDQTLGYLGVAPDKKPAGNSTLATAQ